MPLIRVKNLTAKVIMVPLPLHGKLEPQKWTQFEIARLHSIEGSKEFQRAVQRAIITYEIVDNPGIRRDIEHARGTNVDILQKVDTYLQEQIDSGVGGSGTHPDLDPVPPYYAEPTYGGINNIQLITMNYWLDASRTHWLKRIEYSYSGMLMSTKIQRWYKGDGHTVDRQYTTTYTYSGIRLTSKSMVRDF